MGTIPEPERIWITRAGGMTRLLRSRPAGEACVEYRKVAEHPAKLPAAAEDEAPVRRQQQRDHKPAKNREAKPAVRKAPAKKTGGRS